MGHTFVIERQYGKEREKREVMVDESDLPRISRHPWHIHNKHYAATVIHGKGKKEYLYLHRLVLAEEISLHEKSGRRARILFSDGNRLNCTRANLSIQKAAAKPKAKPRSRTSRYRGVSFIRLTNRWRAKLVYAKRDIIEMHFKSEHEALLTLNFAKADLNKEIAAGEYGQKAKFVAIEEWVGPTKPIDLANSTVIGERVADRMNGTSREKVSIMISLDQPASEEVLKRFEKAGIAAKGEDIILTALQDAMQISALSHLPSIEYIDLND